MVETRWQSASHKHAPGDLFAQGAATMGCELDFLSATNRAQHVKAVGTLLWTCYVHTKERGPSRDGHGKDYISVCFLGYGQHSHVS